MKTITIKSEARKNLIAFGVTAVVISVLLLLFVFSKLPDIVGFFGAPFELDITQAVRDLPPQPLEKYAEFKDIMLWEDEIEQSEFFLATLYDRLYRQGFAYLFTITADEVIETTVEYGTTAEGEGPTLRELVCVSRGMAILVRVPFDKIVRPGDKLTGVLTPMNGFVAERVAAAASRAGLPKYVFAYEFNTSLQFGFERTTALTLGLIALAAAALLMWRFLRQVFDPLLRPLYSLVAMLHGDIADIDAQLKDATPFGRSWETPEWIITPGLYKTTISKTKA